MDNAERDRIMDAFRMQEFNTLITTNVMGRGIDVPEVDIVINFDIPQISNEGYMEPDYANYLHRIGRTGRFGTDGIALTLVERDEDGVNPHMMKKIAEYYNAEIKEVGSIEEFLKVYKEMRKYLYDTESG